MKPHRVLKNILSVLGSEVLVKIFSFLVTLYVARGLGAASLGRLSFALSLVTLFAVLGDLGISRLTTRDIARDRSRLPRFVPAAFTLKLLLAGVTALALIAVSFWLNQGADIALYVRLFALWLFFDSICLFLRAIFTALEEMEYVGLLRAVEKLILFLCFLAVLVLLPQGKQLSAIVLLYPVSAALAMLLGLALLARRKIPVLTLPRKGDWSDILRAGWPFAGSLLLANVYLYSDTVILGYLKSEISVTGLYNAAYKLFITLFALQALLSEVFFPTFSRLFSENRERFAVFGRRVLRLLFGLTIPLTVGCVVLAPDAIALIYGADYEASVLSFRILSLDFILRAALSVVGATLLVSGREKRYLTGIAAGAALNLILNFTLIPAFSLDGAAAATVVSEALVLILLARWAMKIQPVAWLRALSTAMLAALGMGVVLVLISSAPLALKVLAGMATYALCLSACGGLKRDDLSWVRRLIGGPDGQA